jgi:hypothetical protein
VADGVLYVESDRGVVYYNNQGFWVYLAGTMWDTVNPDHRPTDLGPQDANFDYRGTDIAREFIWTGYKWVETTVVRYGFHADRLALVVANVIDGELFIEWDRPFVIYQAQGGYWHYIGGTMWGTYSPDQRPTDLGARDAGFDFRGTDIVRQSLWSGTAWESPDPTTTKGDLLARSSTEIDRLPVGADTQILTADSSQPLGVKWAPANSTGVGAVSSVFGRSGAVSAASGDYTASQVTNAVSQTASYADPAWISSLAYSKITGAPAAGVSSFKTRTGAVVPAAGDYTAAQVTGAVSDGGLTHANVVTKVGSAGQIVEGGITDLSAANSNSLYITAAGIAGIGAGSSPSYRLHVVQAQTSNILAQMDQLAVSTITNSQYCLIMGYGNPGTGTNAGVVQAQAGGTGTQLLLNPSGGDVGIGYSNPGYLLQLGTDSAGKPATSTWSVVSDSRMKRNIEPVSDNSLAILDGLKWIRYEYNGRANTPAGLKAIGLEADGLRALLPEAVRTFQAKLTESDAEETDLLAIDYHHVLVHTARAVQQLAAEIRELKQKV